MSVRDGNSEDLVRRAAGGDVAAVDALLLRYLPALEGYVARRAGTAVRQRESRSDLVQSVCREVLEDLRSQRFEYRGERQFRQWLYRVALRKVQGRGRSLGAARRAVAREVRLADVSSRERALAESRTPSRAVAAREDLARFRAAMARLDETSRQVVEWVYFGELQHRDVAERLGITEGHSRVLLSRALARIARLAAEGDAGAPEGV